MSLKKNSGTIPLALTMGCPAGIGPEIILKAACQEPDLPPFVVVGDIEILERATIFIGENNVVLREWGPGLIIPEDSTRKNIYVYPVTHLSARDIPVGRPSEATGRASFAYLSRAMDLCMENLVSGIVTAPLSKTGLRLAGLDWPGHTEILAERTGTENFLMMMAGSRLNVTLVTIHEPLSAVPSLLTRKRVLNTIKITYRAMKQDFGLTNPRLAVCGLNPHAGEDGMFGNEEVDLIAPACSEARKKGIRVIGPLPPDTVFHQAAGGAFDAVVCQYHDQGLIPFKLLHFRDGVNVTLGLPIVRTSVDHGTAYDIAGTGRADCDSLVAALRLAALISENRGRFSR